MRKTLSLNKTSDGQSKAKEQKPKPQPTDKDKQAYNDLGTIMTYLYENGYKKVKWRKPLSKNFYNQLRDIIPLEMLSSKRLNAAIKHHVKSPRYLLQMRVGEHRYGVNGKTEGRVNKFEADYAKKELFSHHKDFMLERKRRWQQRNNPNVNYRQNRRKEMGRSRNRS